MKKRAAGEPVDEVDLIAWDTDTKKGTVNTEANRKDVGYLINTWKTCTHFYWVPLGNEFPGLDSVLRKGSKLYFVHVKTGKVAMKTYSWIDDAFKYTKLLFDKLENTKGLEVTILWEQSHRTLLSSESESATPSTRLIIQKVGSFGMLLILPRRPPLRTKSWTRSCLMIYERNFQISWRQMMMR